MRGEETRRNKKKQKETKKKKKREIEMYKFYNEQVVVPLFKMGSVYGCPSTIIDTIKQFRQLVKFGAQSLYLWICVIMGCKAAFFSFMPFTVSILRVLKVG